MKKLFTGALIMFSALASHGQITLEQNYIVPFTGGEHDVQIINLELSGYKYAVRDKSAGQLRIYNLNHSLWKTINIPLPPGYGQWWPAYISEKLFNLDNSIELIVGFTNNPSAAQKQIVMDENSNIIHTVDSVNFDDVPIIQSAGNNTYKMVLQSGMHKWNVYSLPGTIPCDKCGNGLGLGKSSFPSGGGSIDLPVPNPSSGQVKVGYTLPIGVKEGRIDIYNTNGQNVKSFKVDNNFNSINIDNSELPSGTYYYMLQAEGVRSETKKMVIIP